MSDDVLAALKRTIAMHFGVEEEELSLQTRLKADLKLDSLDKVELVMSLEEQFEIVISDMDTMFWRTVGDVQKTIARKIGD